MRVILSADRAWDSQTAAIDPDGNFQIDGIPTGKYRLSPAVKGYGLANNQFEIEREIGADVDDLRITLVPRPR